VAAAIPQGGWGRRQRKLAQTSHTGGHQQVFHGSGAVLAPSLQAAEGKAATLQVLAQVLGYCVTAGSFTLKLPQIQKCLASSSVEANGVPFCL